MLIIQPEPEFDHEGAHGAVWQTLRDWMSNASRAIRLSPAQLTRADITPIRRWLFLLETTLRRLILLAAITFKLDIVPRWRRAGRKTHKDAKPRNKPASVKPGFKLFSVRWPRPPARPRILLLDAPPPKKTRLRIIASRPFVTWQSDTLLQAGETREQRKSPRTLTRRRSDLPPNRPERIEGDLLPSDLRGILLPQRLNRTAGRPPGLLQQPAALIIETKSEPETLSREVMVERFLALVKLIARPQKLIRRAALAMARRRELAMRLGFAAPPRPRGRMHACIDQYTSTLIPLHRTHSHALMQFAASYTEPDSS